MPETPTALEASSLDVVSRLLALHSERADLEARNKEMTEKVAKARGEAIQAIRDLMRAYDIRFIEINPPQFLYRDPATGATWTGRGQRPTWLKGKDCAQFRVPVPASN